MCGESEKFYLKLMLEAFNGIHIMEEQPGFIQFSCYSITDIRKFCDFLTIKGYHHSSLTGEVMPNLGTQWRVVVWFYHSV